MAEITIGKDTLRFDLNAITISEYRKFAKGSLADDQDDEILARTVGKTVEWVQNLSQQDYRRVLKGFFDAARAPLDDPN